MNSNIRKNIINMTVIITLFSFYTLKFLVPAFYAVTDKYAGLFVFLCEGLLLLNNYNVIKALKDKDREFIFIVLLILIIGVNLILVKSGFGAFFTAANFALILFSSDKIILTKKQVTVLSGIYLLMLLYWLVILYPSYFGSYYASFALNTNGAATFSTYTALCALIFLQIFYTEENAWVEIPIVLLFVRIIRLALWHRARGAFIILTCFIFLFYILKGCFVNSKKAYTILISLASLGSLVFVFFYTMLGKTGFNMELPIFYKNIFSGRENIWYEFFTYFIKKPLTGIGTNLTIESFFEFNVHNAMYDILVIHGFIVFAMTMYLLFKRFLSFREKAIDNKIVLVAICVLLSVFFESYIDVDLIWADYSVNLIFLLAVINAKYE